MNTDNSVNTQVFIDVSSHAAKRRTLRRLVKVTVALTALCVVQHVFWSLPQDFQQAVDKQWETMSQRRLLIFAVAACLLCGCGIVGLFKLWHFKSEGAVLLCFYQFIPPYPVTGRMAWASTESAVYTGSLTDLAVGMLLLFCWTQPDVFEPSRESPAPTPDTGT